MVDVTNSLTEFSFEGPSETEFDLFAPSFGDESIGMVPEGFGNYLAQTYSAALDKPAEAILGDIVLGNLPIVQEETKSANKLKNSTFLRKSIVNSMTMYTPEELQEKVKDVPYLQDAIVNSVVPDIDALLFSELEGEEDITSTVDKVKLHRLHTLKRIAEERMSEVDDSWRYQIGYFIDLLVTEPTKGVATAAGFRRASKAEEIRSLINDLDVSEEEFIERTKEIIENEISYGLLSEENPIYLSILLEDIEYGGGADILFNVLDMVPIAGQAFNQARRMLKGSTSVSAITALKPTQEAAEFVKGVAKAEPDSIVKEGSNIAHHIAPGSQRVGGSNPNKGQFSHVDSTAMRQIDVENKVKQVVDSYDFGHFIQPEAWERVKEGLAKRYYDEMEDIGGRRYITHYVDLGPGNSNPLFTVVYGRTKGGAPFKSKDGAQKLADDIGGEVIPYGEKDIDGSDLWVVKKEKTIPTQDLVDPTSETELSTHFLQGLLSPDLTSSQRLNSIIQRSEGQVDAVFGTIGKQYRQLKNKVGKKDRNFVDQFLFEIQSGEQAYRKNPIKPVEFKQAYRKAFGTNPSDTTMEYFELLQDFNDTSYYITADRLFKEAVNQGEEVMFIPGDAISNRRVRKINICK